MPSLTMTIDTHFIPVIRELRECQKTERVSPSPRLRIRIEKLEKEADSWIEELDKYVQLRSLTEKQIGFQDINQGGSLSQNNDKYIWQRSDVR